jgi:hypothetical protein
VRVAIRITIANALSDLGAARHSVEPQLSETIGAETVDQVVNSVADFLSSCALAG